MKKHNTQLSNLFNFDRLHKILSSVLRGKDFFMGLSGLMMANLDLKTANQKEIRRLKGKKGSHLGVSMGQFRLELIGHGAMTGQFQTELTHRYLLKCHKIMDFS